MYNFHHGNNCTLKGIVVAFMLVPASFFLFSQQPEFLLALVSELADATKSQVARMAAGLQLKNQLTSKDATVRLQYQQRWMTLGDKIKSHVKTMVRNFVKLKCVWFYISLIPGFTPGLMLFVLLPVSVLQAIQTLGTENARPAIAPQASLSSMLCPFPI